MSFIGRLEDMPFQDIVQMLSMSKRVGKLILTRGPQKAAIVFKDGDIFCAASDSGREKLGHLLVTRQLISESTLHQALRMQERQAPDKLLGTILLDMGAITSEGLESVIREQIEKVILELLTWDSGCFKFQPIATEEQFQAEIRGSDLAVTSGLKTQHLMLEGLRSLDEAAEERSAAQRETATENGPAGVGPSVTKFPLIQGQTALSMVTLPQGDARRDPATESAEVQRETPASEFLDLNELLGEEIRHHPKLSLVTPASHEVALIKSIIQEVRSPSFSGEVGLMIMRYAAEVLTRGILFAVRPDGFSLMGQFGVPSSTQQSLRRTSLKVPASERFVLWEVVRSQQIFRGKLPQTAANTSLAAMLGTETPDEVIAVPMIVDGRVLAILYADHSPDNTRIGSLECIELLMIYAGLGLRRHCSRASSRCGAPATCARSAARGKRAGSRAASRHQSKDSSAGSGTVPARQSQVNPPDLP